MDLNTTTESYGVSDYRWLRSTHGIDTGVPVSIAVADLDEDTHYPDGALVSGLLLAKYTSGANDGLWGIYTPGASDGRQTPTRVLFDSPPIRKNADGTLVASIVYAASLLPIGLIVDVAHMPGVLNNSDAATPITAAVLPAGINAV